MRRTERIESLDSLRGIASFIVVIFHCMLSFPIFYYANYKYEYKNSFIEFLTVTPLHTLWAGKEAVLLFFVLSGFVLSVPFFNSNKLPNYGVYLVRRFFRIYIPYIVIMMASVVLVELFSSYKDIQGLSSTYNNRWEHGVSLKSIVAYFLMLDSDTANVNGVVWTLYHEMRISIIFPFFIAILIRFKAVKGLLISLGLTFVLFTSLNGITIILGENSIAGILNGFKESVYYCTFFIFGATLCKYREKLNALKSLSQIYTLLLFSLSLVLINCRWINQIFSVQSSIIEDFVSVIGILLLFAIVLTSKGFSKFLTKKPLIWLGGISYSLYLIHIPVLMLTTIFIGKLIPLEIAFILVPFISLPVAHITHKYIEVPANTLGKKFSNSINVRLFNKKIAS